jgi:hypothetical protein
MGRHASPAYRLVLTGLLCWALAGTAYAALWLTFGDRPVYVHVRWAPSVDDTARQRLERHYSLALAEPKEDRTFGYALLDRSHENIRNLVLDSEIEDTHQIHRTAFRVGYFAQRLPYVTSAPTVPAGLELLTLLSFVIGLVAFGFALLGIAAPALVRGPILTVRNALLDPFGTCRRLSATLLFWVAGRIPDASAESAALFRIVFGSAVLILVLTRPVLGVWLDDPANLVSSAQRLVLQTLFVDAPWGDGWLQPWVAFWGVLFVVGAFARTAFAGLTVGVVAWAMLYTTRTTHHTVTALMLALLALQGSRWGDAWSVDAWRRRARPCSRATPQHYGYIVWAPALVLGIVYAAAALAKLGNSGFAWILNGTVKYHFLSDSHQAMVEWGPQIGFYPWLAVLLSFGAIAIELLIVVGVCSRDYRSRLVAGGGALSLLAGFAIFQGVLWPAWWILTLSFLPWHLATPGALSQAPAPTRSMSPGLHSGRFPKLAVFMVLALVAQQLVVSLLKIESSPVLSTYDMYSTSYGSPADYEQKAGQQYWIVGLDSSAQAHRCRISQVDADTIAGDVTPARLLTGPILRSCFAPSIRLQSISVESTRVHVDWARWRLEEPVRILLAGPIALDPTL